MAVKTIPDTRQYPLSVYVPFSYEDELGVADATMTLFATPVGTIILDIDVFVATAFASGGGTHDCNIGDITDPNEYNAGGAIELDATGIPAQALAISGYTTTSSEPSVLLVMIDGTNVATSGVAILYATYLVTTRASENYEA